LRRKNLPAINKDRLAVLGGRQYVPLLRDLPTLLVVAPNPERRAVVRERITQVYVQCSVVMAIRPKKIAAALFEAAAMDHRDEWLKRVFWWAGWGSTLRNEPFLTSLFEQLKAPRRFRVAA
jgi:hypothetical protein